MNTNTIIMEEYFDPGFKTKPAVFVGSQTHPMLRMNRAEQAWEGYHLAGASSGDVAVVRGMDPKYLEYWKTLMGDVRIINLPADKEGDFLSQVILDDPKIQDDIIQAMSPNASLIGFFPTMLEQKVAISLGIPFHGRPDKEIYGTKAGIRELANSSNITMVPGYVCTTRAEVRKAIGKLQDKFPTIIIKHTLSFSGYGMKKITLKDLVRLDEILDEICSFGTITGKQFQEGIDILVVEGWVTSKAALCAQIEIVKGQKPVICAAWQQVMDEDGVSYLGGGPLRLSDKAMKSFLHELEKTAAALEKEGLTGSFGPDFLIIGDDENLQEDSCVLIEMNYRVPYTAFPLEIIKQVKGRIGTGFYSRHIKLKKKRSFKDIAEVLEKNKLLITEKSPLAVGVVPYNIGMLDYNLFDLVAIGTSWDEAQRIMQQATDLFKDW